MKKIKKDKLFDPLAVQFAIQECAIQCCLEHDNVVKLYEYTETETEYIIFMEYVNDANYFTDNLVEVSLQNMSSF